MLKAQMLDDPPESNNTRVDTLLMSKSLPDKVKTRLKIRQAVLSHMLGDKQSARQQLQALMNQRSDPEFIADLLLTSDIHGIDFPEAVIKAATLAQNSNGRRMTRLYLALGSHYLRKNDTVWVMQDRQLDIRPEDVVLSDREFAYVSNGLSPGDLVVTTDLATVVAGAPLRLSGEMESE